jgi:hypothetical protein
MGFQVGIMQSIDTFPPILNEEPMRPNPDAPSLPAESLPRYKLYSPHAVWLASFAGGPIGGAVLLGLNYRRLGQPRAAALSVLGGALVTGALVGVGLLVPSWTLVSLPLLMCFAMQRIARSKQSFDFINHIEDGGQQGSPWAALGIGFACFAAVMVVLTGALVGWYAAHA